MFIRTEWTDSTEIFLGIEAWGAMYRVGEYYQNATIEDEVQIELNHVYGDFETLAGADKCLDDIVEHMTLNSD